MIQIGAVRLRRRTVWVMAIVLFVLTLGLSIWLTGSPPPRMIVLATGDPSGGVAALGNEYKARLDRMGLRVELIESSGSLENLERLQRGVVDVAFVQAGTAQLLDRKGGVSGLAAIGVEPLWVFSRSLPRAASLRELRGHTIVLGPPVSGTDALSRLVLREHGVTPANATFLNMSMAQSRQALLNETADTLMLVSSCRAPIIHDLMRDPDIHLVNLTGQAAMVRRLPYLHPVVLPEGVLDLEHNLPREDRNLLAPTMELAAREDLHPRAVEQLLLAAQAIHAPGGLLEDPGRFPTLEGMDLPPHLAAEKFMKSGESFLAQHLPYWVLRLLWQAQILLLPVVILLLPFWKTLPLLYTVRINLILKRHYTALREVENQIDHCDDPAELARLLDKLDGLRTDLETLSRKLPTHLQRDVYHWRQHVALVRTEGQARLQRLQARQGPA